jgi:hypothetical protein
MTAYDEYRFNQFRKMASWGVFLALLTTNVILAVNLTAARHELAKIEASR